MADPTSIREGIAANLAAAIHGCQISAWRLANPTPPSLRVIGIDRIDYDTAFQRGGDTWTFVVQGFVGSVSDIGAQQRLGQWIASSGSDSVKEAIESDRTLGGAADTLRVTAYTGDKLFTLANVGDVLGGEWEIQVETSG